MLVLLGCLVLLGITWRFGIRDEGAAPSQPSGPVRLPPFADRETPGDSSVGLAEVRRQLERLVRIGRPVRCGGGNEPVVALTFDDGPGPRTHEILRILAVHRAPGTFFVVGNRLELPGTPSVDAFGPTHVLGNHTWSHASLRRLSPRDRRAEILSAQRALEEAVGSEIDLFRPPYGHRDERLDRLISRLGLVQVIWSSTSGDDRPSTPTQMVRRIRSQVRPGAIVLMHEHPATIQALPRILQLVRARGLRPVTVPELLAIDPPTRRQLRDGRCPVGGTPDAISAETGGGRP